jgi:uncharacterized membrane protein YebE (DUF533 family)
MFDARSLLEQLMRGSGQGQAQPSQPQAGGLGGLGDILGQLGQAMGQPQGGRGGAAQESPAGGLGDILGQLGKAMGQQGRQIAPESPGQGAPAAPGGSSLEDLLRNMLPGGGSPSGSPAPTPQAQPQGGGGLGDILGRITESLGQNGSAGKGSGGTPGGGSLMDILGQVLGQATQGVKEGANRIDDATGASGHMRDAVGKATGKSPDELMAQLKELIQNNQLGAGAVAGGLGSILLGTRTGRSIAATALKLGGLALVGGLAYKAVQNYQQGRSPLGGADASSSLTEAPRGSGFEASAVTNEAAQLYIRAMIAAAAADGRIDAKEQQKILGGLKQAGLDAEAEVFLTKELNSPASVEDLVRGISTEAEAVQLYTAARISVDLDTAEEHEFLVSLARALGINEELAAHIDAQARAAV